MSAGAYLFLGIFVAAAVRPSFCKIRGDSTCYWASALLEMLFIPSRHHLLLHLIGKRKRTLRLVVNRDVAAPGYTSECLAGDMLLPRFRPVVQSCSYGTAGLAAFCS